MHKLLRQQGRGDDSPSDNHSILRQYGVDDWVVVGKLYVRQCKCNKTDSQDNPSDNSGILLSNNFHQKPCCAQLTVNPLLVAQSVSILLEKLALLPYLLL